MSEMTELFARAKSYLNDSEYEEFVNNAIRTIGYNSNTFSLIESIGKTINTTEYVDGIKADIKECSKLNNKEAKDVDLGKDYNQFKAKMCEYISDEEFDGIMFDWNVKMVDDYLNRNKIYGISLVDNVKNYLNDFKTGDDLISNSPDYQSIKEDLYNDAGLTLVGLENLAIDTSDLNDKYANVEDEDLALEIDDLKK